MVEVGLNIEAILNRANGGRVETDTFIAYHNDWSARDQEAIMQRTHTNGRFSYEARFLMFGNGKWYCCYK